MENSNKITFKNSQLTPETIKAINNLLEVDINAAMAFKLARIIKEISSIFEDKKSTEDKLIEKWAELDESGNIKIAKDENGSYISGSVVIKDIKKFNEEMSNLGSVINELNAEKIRFEDLNLETAKIKELIMLDFLFY